MMFQRFFQKQLKNLLQKILENQLTLSMNAYKTSLENNCFFHGFPKRLAKHSPKINESPMKSYLVIRITLSSPNAP